MSEVQETPTPTHALIAQLRREVEESDGMGCLVMAAPVDNVRAVLDSHQALALAGRAALAHLEWLDRAEHIPGGLIRAERIAALQAALAFAGDVSC